jgi:dTDP-4-dehydrorhamnose reductase
MAGSGHTSPFEWVQKILELNPRCAEQVVQTLEPEHTEGFPTPTARTLLSALNSTSFETTLSLRLPLWEVTLRWVMESRGYCLVIYRGMQ